MKEIENTMQMIDLCVLVHISLPFHIPQDREIDGVRTHFGKIIETEQVVCYHPKYVFEALFQNCHQVIVLVNIIVNDLINVIVDDSVISLVIALVIILVNDLVKLFLTSLNKTFSKNNILFFLFSRDSPLASSLVLGLGLVLALGNGCLGLR